MQRSDVLTGLSIRLGPALKIYERHVKVLQRTHFLEYEDLWSCDAANSAALIWWRTRWPLPFGSCRLPSCPLYVESGRVRRLWWWIWLFTVRMTRNWRKLSSYLSLWPFIFQWFSIFTWLFFFLGLHRGRSRLLRSLLVLKWWHSDHAAAGRSWKSLHSVGLPDATVSRTSRSTSRSKA